MTNTYTKRLAWEDRWTQPKFEDLITPLKSHHLRSIEMLLAYLQGHEQIKRSVLWYGPAWKWSIQLATTQVDATAPKHAEMNTVLYLVPKVETPLICVPIHEDRIPDLLTSRLGRYAKDGLRVSKCAVSIHWAVWTPTSQAETIQIIDLLRKLHPFLTPLKTGKPPKKSASA
jgi:hypothetical protein